MSLPLQSEQFMELMTLHQGQLFGYIFAIAQDLDDTQDIFQQTSLVMWRKFVEFDGQNFPAWASRIARFEALNFLRAKRRYGAILNEGLLAELSLLASRDDPSGANRREALAVCLGKLHPGDRKLVDRCYAGHGTIAAVATELGRSAQSVCNSLRRIRRALFDCIDRQLAREERS